ncbi:hypothetical protein EYF80_001136 [Liparis tanakae]|uniref:Uncharacterized protein n=1 Tax=Liparis tanakae TaxID=230148 RepID=A0A4Z2JG82_9TELE|nr:hypothetical protein EYF80_001136 [Liparis tanakae]
MRAQANAVTREHSHHSEGEQPVTKWPVIGLIDCRSEALVAASSSDHILARSMEGEEFVSSVDL